MGLLTKQAILNAADLRTEDVSVPEWGGTVRARTLTGAERDAFESSMTVMVKGERQPNVRNLRARLVAACLVDEGGARLFDDGEVASLGGKSAAALDRVFSICQRLNGFTAADVEDMEKNSASDQSAEPGSDSPAVSA